MKRGQIDPNMLKMIELAEAAASNEVANELIETRNLRIRKELRHGRAAALNPVGRFEKRDVQAFDDGWEQDAPTPLKTTVKMERARSIISRNQSPDQPFDCSINPYRGCEHGCIYCYARPSHAHIGLSAGLDFETQLFAKPDAAKLLAKELSHPHYQPKPIFIGTNTDPYQPIERRLGLMREILDVLARAHHPVEIITKSALILRDVDMLAEMAAQNLVRVALSITTLDNRLARAMEPRAATPSRRLHVIQQLALAKVPTSVMIAPIIPGLSDHEMEKILDKAVQAGAQYADYILLRLPFEVAPLFKDWLMREYPHHYRRVLSQLRAMRKGKDYDAAWQTRFRGEGVFADLLARRFELSIKRLGINRPRPALSMAAFTPPLHRATQLSLF